LRDERRIFNETVLETKKPVHSMAERFISIIDEEVDALFEKLKKSKN